MGLKELKWSPLTITIIGLRVVCIKKERLW